MIPKIDQMLSQFLVPLLFGWSAATASLGLGGIGIYLKKTAVILAGGVLVLGHTYYLSGAPLFRWPALLLPLGYLAAPMAVRSKWYGLAWVFLTPQLVVDAWLALTVLRQ
jgi:hypothetical protein